MDPIALIHEFGLLVIFGVIFLEQFGLPLPALPLLLAAGAIAVSNPLFGWAALLLAVVASVGGGSAMYFVGRKRGDAVLGLICRLSLSPTKCVVHGRTAFDRIGPSALIFARFMPGLMALAPPLAGSVGMSLPVFLTFQTLSALLFAMFGLGLGYAFDGAVQAIVAELNSYLAPAAWVLVACVAAWLAYVFISRRHR